MEPAPILRMEVPSTIAPHDDPSNDHWYFILAIAMGGLFLLALVAFAIQYYILKGLQMRMLTLEKQTSTSGISNRLSPREVNSIPNTLRTNTPSLATTISSEEKTKSSTDVSQSGKSVRKTAAGEEHVEQDGTITESTIREAAGKAISWAEFLQSRSTSSPKKSSGVSNKEPQFSKEELLVFIKSVRQLVPMIADYNEHPEKHPVTGNRVPGFIYSRLPPAAPEKSCTFEDIMKDFTNIIFPGLNHWQHPSFFAYFPLGRSLPDVLAEVLISAMAIPAHTWEVSPSLAELEVTTVNWVGRALGLPESFLFHGNSETSPGGGFLPESASESVYMSMVAARTKKINDVLQQKGMVPANGHYLMKSYGIKEEIIHQIASSLVVYSNTEAHSCIDKACQMATLRFRPIQGKDEYDYALQGDQLEEAILQDMKLGLVPAAVHATLGTTSSCAFDNIASIGPVAKKYNVWLHVDAAYAGATWIDPKHRKDLEGIENVDSIDVNLHKFLLHSNSLSLLWTQDQASFRMPFISRNWKTSHSKPFSHDPSSWGIHDLRRAKALKIWFIFRCYGVSGLQKYVNLMIDLCGYFRELLLKHPNVRPFGPQKAALFSFQYFEPGLTENKINEYSHRLSMYINESEKMLLTHSCVDGHDIVRISVGYEMSQKEDIESAWEILKAIIDNFKEKKDDPSLLKIKKLETRVSRQENLESYRLQMAPKSISTE